MEADLLTPSARTPAATPGDPDQPASRPLEARWLGRIAYDDAHALQRRLAAERADGLIGDQLLLLEHPAVLTLGRNSDPAHILASAADLDAPWDPGRCASSAAARSPTTAPASSSRIRSSRCTSAACSFGRSSARSRPRSSRPVPRSASRPARRDGHPGCWCDPDGPAPRKIGALGLRVERGVTYHGIALNVTVDLADFELIDPCGMPGVVSTSIARELGEAGRADPRRTRSHAPPSIFARAFADAIDAPLAGELPD